MSESKKANRKRSRSPSTSEESDDDNKDYLGLDTEAKEKAESAESQKPISDVPVVHSVNKWEDASLGDEQRKAKFLKLMGGAKKEHTGRFVCGTKSTDEADKSESSEVRKPDEKLESKLESQYKESMTNALKQRDKRHRGLGYHGETEVDLEAREKDPIPDTQPPPAHVHDAKVDPAMHFVKPKAHQRNPQP